MLSSGILSLGLCILCHLFDMLLLRIIFYSYIIQVLDKLLMIFRGKKKLMVSVFFFFVCVCVMA